jgi:crotonobetainyl-CoA:carnitine CoA-transferase CaiB-like acyl-CoA transferase
MAQANADGFAALGVATTLLLGLVGWARFGGPNVLRCSMISTMTHALADSVTKGSGASSPAPDEGLYGLGPYERVYETAAGWVMVAVGEGPERAAFAECCGVNGEGVDVESEFEAAFRTGTAAEWRDRLSDFGLTCVVVAPKGVDETMLLGDLGPELGFVTTETHPSFGEYPRLAALTRFSRSRSVIGPAPLLGQQTDAILEELKVAALP